MYARLVACSLALAAAFPLQGHEKTLDVVISRSQAQERKQLCWAATSVSIVNSALTTGQLADASNLLTQEQLVTDAKAVALVGSQTAQKIEAWTTQQGLDIHARALAEHIDVKAQCRGMPAACVAERSPMIKDVAFEHTEPGEALSWCEVRNQVEHDRPILFGIQEAKLQFPAVNGRKRTVHTPLHFLMVVGARDTEGVNEVLVWDPWPATTPGMSRDESDHKQWIPYTTFKSPKNSFGVDATHQFDRYNFHKAKSAWAAAVPSKRGVCAPTPVSAPVNLAPMPSDRLWEQFRPDLVATSPGRLGLPNRRTGDRREVAMPVLAISGNEILRTRGDARQLMLDRISTVIVADSTDSRISHVYELLNDQQGWRREGYVSLGIVRRVFESRQRRGGDAFEELKRFYMVAVPSIRAFFLAVGPPGPDTPLIPIADDPDLCIREGRDVTAGELLPRIHQAMLREAGLPVDGPVQECRE